MLGSGFTVIARDALLFAASARVLCPGFCGGIYGRAGHRGERNFMVLSICMRAH